MAFNLVIHRIQFRNLALKRILIFWISSFNLSLKNLQKSNKKLNLYSASLQRPKFKFIWKLSSWGGYCLHWAKDQLGGATPMQTKWIKLDLSREFKLPDLWSKSSSEITYYMPMEISFINNARDNELDVVSVTCSKIVITMPTTT